MFLVQFNSVQRFFSLQTPNGKLYLGDLFWRINYLELRPQRRLGSGFRSTSRPRCRARCSRSRDARLATAGQIAIRTRNINEMGSYRLETRGRTGDNDGIRGTRTNLSDDLEDLRGEQIVAAIVTFSRRRVRESGSHGGIKVYHVHALRWNQ